MKELTDTLLQVPYQEKDKAKKLGACWNPKRKTWYVPEDTNPAPLERWLPKGVPLKIELVPDSCWWKNVRSHVSRVDWDKLRKHIYAKAGYCCEICKVKGRVEAHEIWRYDEKQHFQGKQTLIDIIALCRDCHQVKHFGLAQVQGRDDIAIRHLMRINGWTMGQAQQYINAQFDIWSQRNQVEWQLDIFWLNQLEILSQNYEGKMEEEPAVRF